MAHIHKPEIILAVMAGGVVTGEMPVFETPSEKGLGKRSRVAFRSKVRTGPKVGRNEPCPCGSGKKFKKCCIDK